MNLARKYRPMIFADVVGQEHVKKIIKNSLKKDGASHAYLFFGSRGTGKTTLARLVAKAINCENPQEGEPCNQCEICISANEGRLVDLIEIDAASNRSIDEIRAIKEKIGFSPTMAKKKIYIIDEVHMMTKEAFNALLKTLEEPPSHVYFILATTELHKIPETIQSRCQIFAFQKFSNELITQRLEIICQQENIEFETSALQTIANEAQGGLRDAIFLLEQHSSEGRIVSENLAKELGIAPQAALNNIYQYIQNQEMAKSVNLISDIASEGLSLGNFSKSFLIFLREKMLKLLEHDPNKELDLILHIIEVFSKAHNELKSSIIPSLPLEIAIVTLGQKEKSEKSGGWFSFNIKSPKEQENKQDDTELKSQQLSSQKTKDEEVNLKNALYEAEEINVEIIEKYWNQISDRISDFALKMAIKQCRIKSADNQKVVLAFSSESFKEKIDDQSGNRNVAKAFEAVFKIPLKIETILETISLEPASANDQKIINTDPNKKLSGKDLEDAIKEVFI